MSPELDFILLCFPVRIQGPEFPEGFVVASECVLIAIQSLNQIRAKIFVNFACTERIKALSLPEKKSSFICPNNLTLVNIDHPHGCAYGHHIR